jgi:hypothetical protein
VAGELKKVGLDLCEHARRDEAVCENPGAAGDRLHTGVGPRVDVMLGDDHPARFVIEPDRLPGLERNLDPTLAPLGAEWVISRITTK